LSVAFSPGGKLLAAGSGDGTDIRLWDVGSGRLLRSLRSQEGAHYVRGVAFSPDGKWLAATDNRKGVIVWDAQTWKESHQLPTPGEIVWSVTFSADSRRLAASSESGIRVWDATTGKPIAEPVEAHRGMVTDVAFSAEPGVVVTGSMDTTVRFWDAVTGRQREVIRHGTYVGFALAPDGKRLATSAHDDTVRLWDVATGKQLLKLPGHGKYGGRYGLHFFPDGERLASWGDDFYLRVWQTTSGKALLEHPIHVGGLGPFKDDKSLEAQKRKLERDALMARIGPLSANCSADGSLFVLDLGIHSHVFDVATGKEVRKIVREGGGLFGSAISPDGRWLLSAGANRFSIWDLATGKVVQRIPFSEGRVGPVAFSASGRLFAAGFWERGPIRIWEVASGEVVRTIETVGGPVRRLAFSPDGRLLASAMNDTTVLIWDLAEKWTRPQGVSR
jgi:WD40 repeat protein